MVPFFGFFFVVVVVVGLNRYFSSWVKLILFSFVDRKKEKKKKERKKALVQFHES